MRALVAQSDHYLKRLFIGYALPYKGVLLAGFIGMIFLSIASVAPAKLIEDVVDKIFVEKSSQMLWPVTFFIVGAFFLKGAAAYGAHIAMDYVGQRVVSGLQKDIFSKAIDMDINFFDKTHAGDLVSRMVNDVGKLQNAVTGTFTSAVKDTLTFLFFVALMFYQDWVLATIAFCTLPIAVSPIRKIGRRIKKTSGQVQQNMAILTTLVSQAFQGIRLIKSYVLESFEKRKLHDTVDRLVERQFKASRLKSLNHPVMEFLGGLAVALIIAYGGHKVISGQQTPGAFFSFIAALLMVYEPLKRLAQLNGNLNEQMASAERVFEIIDLRPTILSGLSYKSVDFMGDIIFNDVNFSYEANNSDGDNVIKNLSMSFPAGKRIAIVGHSGGGKSTIFNLILRFYDPLSGSIAWGGVDIKELDRSDLRRNIALVSQDSVLFDGTIEENIHLGCLKADKHMIVAAAKAADAHDFIMELPHGYSSGVGEWGGRLSGGQKQRISIARAILKNAPLLLLDEPTSALDARAEMEVQKALDHLMKGRTTVTIAHRLSTIKDADLIYVVDKGCIHSFGTFSQLQNNSSLFRGWLAEQAL
jgi:subfamily B ATP-binding cassette protein MsbA